MTYEGVKKEFTEVMLPQVWEKAVQVEKQAELLVYDLMVQCMENFMDVSIELEANDPVNGVLRSWARREASSFGSNAIFLNPKEDGGLIIGCNYDIWKLREDVDVIINDLFGSIDPTRVGEKVMEVDVEMSTEDVGVLFRGISKKLIPLDDNDFNCRD